MEIKTTDEIFCLKSDKSIRIHTNHMQKDYNNFCKKKWVAVDDLLEWIKKHDSKIEDAIVYHHNGGTYLKQTYHTISIKEMTEELSNSRPSGADDISSKKDCSKCHKNLLLSEQEIKEGVCCYCRISPS